MHPALPGAAVASSAQLPRPVHAVLLVPAGSRHRRSYCHWRQEGKGKTRMMMTLQPDSEDEEGRMAALDYGLWIPI
jgi:hypothetical protein